MAVAAPKALPCLKSLTGRSSRFTGAQLPTRSLVSSVRLPRLPMRRHRLICTSMSFAGSPQANSDDNPYEVLGVSPIEGFDMIKAAYNRRRKDAERRGDDAYVAELEKAYDKVMMLQLTNRKKGVTFGSFQVSKDIKYADKQPIVPWGPRPSKSSVMDMRINMLLSAVFTIWTLVQRNAEWKPLQFLGFVFFYRIFDKLKSFEPAGTTPKYDEYGEEEGRGLRMGKRLLRSICLVFGCMAVASLGYTGILNLIEFLGRSIPAILFNNQELIVTATTSVLLYIMASYYR
ncbi:uncharacterized protein M6B38_162535 [Iris pallida]|uniref:Chloroplast J-like domain 1 n=1 Tax=Iris pallida TaxID=29817 RepID=A0AAX6F028_IRIPA|nr:uncharacterized protein M6B38_162535 [Iris pallida]